MMRVAVGVLVLLREDIKYSKSKIFAVLAGLGRVRGGFHEEQAQLGVEFLELLNLCHQLQIGCVPFVLLQHFVLEVVGGLDDVVELLGSGSLQVFGLHGLLRPRIVFLALFVAAVLELQRGQEVEVVQLYLF